MCKKKIRTRFHVFLIELQNNCQRLELKKAICRNGKVIGEAPDFFCLCTGSSFCTFHRSIAGACRSAGQKKTEKNNFAL